METKKCSRCQELKPTSSYYRNKSKPDGYGTACKPCQSLFAQEWRRRYPEKAKQESKKNYDKFYDRRLRYGAEYRKRNTEKIKAKSALNRAIGKGTISKLPCEVCGLIKTEGHHWSYLRENWLDVIWLCKDHHGAISRKGVESLLNSKIEQKYLLGLSRSLKGEE